MKSLATALKLRDVNGIYQRLLRFQQSGKTDLSKAIAYNMKLTKPMRITDTKSGVNQWDQMLDTHQI